MNIIYMDGGFVIYLLCEFCPHWADAKKSLFMLLLVMWSLAISQACNSQDYIAFPVVRGQFKMYFTTGGEEGKNY